MTRIRIAGIVVATALSALLISALSQAAYDAHGSGGALLRLSWRLRGAKEQECRSRTQAELDALPAHMRTPEICDTKLLAYRVVVRIDDGAADTLIVLPEGAKGDRPVFVLHDYSLAPGEHRIRVTLAPVDDDEKEDGDDDNDGNWNERGDADRRHAGEEANERHDALAASYVGVVKVRSGAIALITLDSSGRLVRR